jgi:flagellar motor switch protein FliM
MTSSQDTRESLKRKSPVSPGGKAVVFDFRRPDRVPKSQIRVVQSLYEGFLRTLGSSLSADLRTYVKVRLISIEQQTYAEFIAGLTNPTCLVSLGMSNKRSRALLDLSPPLVFSMLEVLLGAKAGASANTSREITEIEQNILDDILRGITQSLQETWRAGGEIDFGLQGIDKDPQAVQAFEYAEPVVVFSSEIQFSELAGVMKFAMSSIAIKMMGQKLERQRSLERAEVSGSERRRLFNMLKKTSLRAEARLQGSSILVRDVLDLQLGQVLALGQPLDQELDCTLNGKLMYKGRIVSTGTKKAFRVDTVCRNGD